MKPLQKTVWTLKCSVNSGAMRLMRAKYNGPHTILFVDEIHRFNKAQQDAFLPHVESGLITLIGATTENPSFEIIPPLLSRCRVRFASEDVGNADPQALTLAIVALKTCWGTCWGTELV